MNKTAIKNFAVNARRKLIEGVTHKAYEVGITEAEILETETFEGGFKIKGRENGKVFRKYELKQREELIYNIRNKGFEQVMEEVAYTWFNRFIALRFMEVNNYLPTGTRVLSSVEEGKTEPDIIKEALNIDLEVDREIIFRLQDSNDIEDLYKYLLIKQCNQLGEIMLSVFEKIADYTELLLPDRLLAEGSVARDLVEEIEEYDWKIELDGEEQEQEAEKGEHGIEIIGWLYQYYISEKKDEVFAGLRKNKKITKENIPAATQLFTPKWIVKYMVENSLGRLWLESHPNEVLKAQWKYYLEEAEQEPEVQRQLDELKNPDLNPEDIKILDPAMGSGHILVYAFDVLYKIYLSVGYSEREIPTLILEKNLYGLDICDRAGQLASFALLMKARSKNRRIFRNRPKMNLCSIQESNGLVASGQWLVDSGEIVGSGEWLVDSSKTVASDQWLVGGGAELIGYFIKGVGKQEQVQLKEDLEYLLEIFHDAKEYGSILEVKEIDFDVLENRIEEIRNDTPEDIFELQCKEVILEKIPPLIQQARIMSKKYDVVCTNPPYMGRKSMNSKLTKYLDKNFKDSRNDLFAVFMELDAQLAKQTGFMAMINQHSWMFLSSFENLRRKIIDNYSIYNMVHLGSHAFREISGEVVQTTTFITRKINIPECYGVYIRVTDWKNANEKATRLLEAIKNPLVCYRYTVDINRFVQIPRRPIAYWVSSSVYSAFLTGRILSDVADIKQGLKTGDNDTFLRIWHEIGREKFSIFGGSKWYPCNKGGDFRKWYGNNDYVLNWENDGFKLKNFRHPDGRQKSRPQNLRYMFKEGLTYTNISSSKLGIRYCPDGFAFDAAGSMVFTSKGHLYYLLGLLSSNIMPVFTSVLSPTMSFEVGQISFIPYIEHSSPQIDALVIENISFAKNDWDSFETSWDFGIHPFFKHLDLGENHRLSSIFTIWETETEEAFNQLKANEEELNRIFIEIYGLQNELTPEVEDKDITISKADRERDIKSFISYAVGCMFGRYSLDKEGLIHAGGNFDDKFRVADNRWEIKTEKGWKESSINIAEHNIIPIADGDYFEDDILERFVEFVKISFGEETLKENLQYIAETLGQRANETSRQAIRRYFLRDFYKDHVRTYKKRPIYWLFNSGEQNAFRALIYMHRYNPSTVARVRTDYLHNLQKKYEAEINHLDILIDSEISGREKAAARKRKEVILKQIQECISYDEVIGHMANQMIEIDLDDGVKVNYAKFQGVKIPQGEGKKPLKANLLSKI